LTELTGPVTDRQRTYLETILASSENLQQMITDLLDLSRIESGHLVLELESLDIKREAENVLRSVQPLLDEKQLKTEVTVAADTTKLKADRTRLWQIINNVVANAVRYSPVAGEIHVRIEDGPNESLLTTITDQGPGIPAEDRSRLLEPFYAKPVGSKGRHGAGLGLAIVKQLVELHGGSVELEDNKGGGARVRFTLPKDARDSTPETR
jgi:signal transduction histidine kinase